MAGGVDLSHFLELSLPNYINLSNPRTMPRATTDRFSRAHQPSVKQKTSNDNGEGSSSGARNPIFNTERFGQHILKNPQVAQT